MHSYQALRQLLTCLLFNLFVSCTSAQLPVPIVLNFQTKQFTGLGNFNDLREGEIYQLTKTNINSYLWQISPSGGMTNPGSHMVTFQVLVAETDD